MDGVKHNRTLFCTLSNVGYWVFIGFCVLSCKSNPEDRPSPLIIEKSKFGKVEVELAYSSPAVRDRQIFGDGIEYLVKYGEMWRTGANEATTFYNSGDLIINSQILDSGKYSIFTIPSEKYWTIIFNKSWNQWGAYNYSDSLDAVRLDVLAKSSSTIQERMRLSLEKDSLKFKWELIEWSIPIRSAVPR